MLADTTQKLKQWLEKQPQWFLALYAGLVAFGTYSCMYAFRKPFTAASFDDIHSGRIHFKVWLVTAQVIGYMCSKFYGIKFISEIRGSKRAVSILILILISWAALLLFAFVPVPVKPFMLFINGFPLGMVWGLVFGFLEGRRTTEIMGAVLASSFIFASGFVKTIGKWLLLGLHVSEFRMPFYTGAIFIIPMFLFVFLLNAIPPPTVKDIALRWERKPMDARKRKAFTRQFGTGLVLVVAGYILITIIRDMRDNFMNEILSELNLGKHASLFTKIETPVTIVVLATTTLLVLVKRNYKAFMLNHWMIILGLLVSLSATILFREGRINPIVWMILAGTGLYMSYVPFNCIFFERMIATYKVAGNVGFVMYIADAFGYLGSLLILFFKEYSGLHISWMHFFIKTTIICSAAGIVLVAGGMFYFSRKQYSKQFIYPLQPSI